MTSGQFRSLSISSITIPAERQRKDFNAIDELAGSIRANGLINPIVVTPQGVLVAGQRRLMACKQLGWTHISVQLTTDLEPLALHIIELEENVKRVDLTWQEQTLAVQQYHKLMRGLHTNWTQTDTANALNISQPNIHRFLAVAQEIEQGNKSVAEAPRFSVARGITERKASREGTQELSNIRSFAPIAAEKTNNDAIQLTDFLEWAPLYSGPKFNFIHCDFPYGINAEGKQGFSGDAYGTYDDTRENFLSLLHVFARNLENFCSPSAHIMFWFSMKNYQELLTFFKEETDFVIQYIPLVWSKHLGIISDPQRTFRNQCEFCLFGSRGDRKIVRTASNHYHGVQMNKEHMSGKYEPMLKHFFSALVDHTTLMLDPTCGSGTALVAAEALGAAKVLGLEINPEFVKIGNASVEKERLLRKVSEHA
jgi:ParB/RepB/Spo0J family partition protein